MRELKTYIMFVFGDVADIEMQLDEFLFDKLNFISSPQVMVIVFKSESSLSDIRNKIDAKKIFFLVDISGEEERIKFNLNNPNFEKTLIDVIGEIRERDEPEMSREEKIDMLLEKINREGYDSLSENEKKFLEA